MLREIWRRLFGWRPWRRQLAIELGRAFEIDGEEYIRQTGEDCWREAFDDGLTPLQAVHEEAYAAATMGG